MASFQQELQKLMTQFGGYAQGIPNVGLEKQQIGERSQRGAQLAGAQDQFGLQRAGMGRSVAGAFSQGSRSASASSDSARQIIDLLTQHGQLKGQQQLGLLNTFAPIAYEEANKPSAFSKFLGGALGLAGQFGIPALGGGDQLQKMLMQAFGGSGGQPPRNAGAGANTGNFNFGFTPYGRR